MKTPRRLSPSGVFFCCRIVLHAPQRTSFLRSKTSLRQHIMPKAHHAEGTSCRRHIMSKAHHAEGTSCRRHIMPKAYHAEGTSCRRHIMPKAHHLRSNIIFTLPRPHSLPSGRPARRSSCTGRRIRSRPPARPRTPHAASASGAWRLPGCRSGRCALCHS